jgi:hypothetical protein
LVELLIPLRNNKVDRMNESGFVAYCNKKNCQKGHMTTLTAERQRQRERERKRERDSENRTGCGFFKLLFAMQFILQCRVVAECDKHFLFEGLEVKTTLLRSCLLL